MSASDLATQLRMRESLGPFHDRPDELALYNPMPVPPHEHSMLELGNKKNGQYTYKAWFKALGYRHVSVDLNGQDGALPLDLTHPLKLGTFDIVTNIGTSEHVSEQTPCWRNIVEACHVGSLLLCTTPLPGGEDWWWHGDHYPGQSFYIKLAAMNGFTVERLYVSGEAPRRMWFARLYRDTVQPFQMPPAALIYRNEIRPR